MPHTDQLRSLFPDLTLIPEDLLLLEPFQIKYLPDRVPEREFAVLLHASPIVRRYLSAACPSTAIFVTGILEETTPVEDSVTVERDNSDALWEVADLLVYNKHPERCDSAVDLIWGIEEIIPPDSLRGEVALDVGAGAESDNPIHMALVSPEWGYVLTKHRYGAGEKLKYHKKLGAAGQE